MTRGRLLAAGLAAVLGAGALAGCGSSDSPVTTSLDAPARPPAGAAGSQGGAPPGVPSEMRAQLQKFRSCLEKQGVTLPTGPPQNGNGPPQIDQAALQACGRYLPQGRPQGAPPSGVAPPTRTS